MTSKSKQCDVCQKEFIPLSSVSKRCSDECKQIGINAVRKKRYQYKGRAPRVCSECQQEFQPSNNKQLACNNCTYKREIRIKRERRSSNPEIIKRERKATAKYRANNKERVRAMERQRYWENPEKFRKKSNQYGRKRYKNDPTYRTHQLEYNKEYRKKYGDELNAERRERYIQDEIFRQKCIKQAIKWHRNNRDRKLIYNKAYYKNNYEKFATRNLTKHTREPIDPTVIKRVYEDYNYMCVYCGQRGGKITIDHITPISNGGTNDINNLCLACHSCNCSKGKKSLLQFLVYLQETQC